MTEELFLEELNRDPHEVPAITGRIHISLNVPLVSLQSKKTSRQAFEDVIRNLTRKYKYHLSGDVGVEITIQVHRRDRYESDASPDLDNFLKPLLDTLSGPEGILIDDCQFRNLTINWISWLRDDSQIEIFLSYIDSEYVNKQRLLFVQMEGPLCMPVDTSLKLSLQHLYLLFLRFGFVQRSLMSRLGADYYTASALFAVHRQFHRTRIKGFPVKP